MGKIVEWLIVKLNQAAMPKKNDTKGKGGKHQGNKKK